MLEWAYKTKAEGAVSLIPLFRFHRLSRANHSQLRLIVNLILLKR
jgi:hypothetical protein